MRKILQGFRFPLSATVFFAALIAAVLAGCAQTGEPGGSTAGQIQIADANANTNNTAASPTPEPAPLALTADNLRDDKPIELSRLRWKYRTGDEPGWADPRFDDAAWDSSIFSENRPLPSRWDGIGWFRLRLSADESIAGQPLGLAIGHGGASEIYVDGKLTHRFGRVGANADEELTYNPEFIPVGIAFAEPGEHLIAIRYSNTKETGTNNFKPPFAPRLTVLNPAIGETVRRAASKNVILGIDFGICFGVGALHLLLFLLNRSRRADLFYSLMLLGSAASAGVAFFLQNTGNEWSFIRPFRFLVFVTALIAFAAYLYTTLERRAPRYLWWMAALWLIPTALLLAPPFFKFELGLLATGLLGVFILLLTVWIMGIYLIVIARAALRRADGAWLIGLVGIFFIVSVVAPAVLTITSRDSNVISSSGTISYVCLVIVNTVFLARQSARTSRELEAQLLKQVEHEKDKARLQLVEAENERRAGELEEARQLQLSMLPKKLPNISNLGIAAYMKPATEVGGDYYDFHVGEDGTLTVAVGDATGHGLKAGTIVTATKSLFNSLAHESDITNIFRQASAALKRMNLRGMFMAMAMIKIKDGAMILSIAGMPSALIYRAASRIIEEHSIRAMPLGSVAKYRYEQREIALAAGDVVVLMSDGFPEMFNPNNEMLGFGKAAELLPGIADRSPQEIINRLVKVGEDWAGARSPDDDVTFVVLKIKSAAI